jgi:tetratricopeptide (TPR) repeat protein
MNKHLFGIALLLAGAAAAQEEPEPPEAMALDGTLLYRSPLLPAEGRDALEENLKAAQARFAEDPASAENIIWLGRRLGYVHRYHEAVDAFTKGVERFPEDPRFYRFRGHRYITLRDFDRAASDLEKAAALAKGKPDEEEPSGTGGRVSSLQFNIYYHLGLAHYLKGELPAAIEAYRECMKVSRDDESKVATSDWLYMALRRNGDAAGAASVLEAIHEGMPIEENTAYYQRLLMYKGLVSPEAVLSPEKAEPLQIATQGYGVANWYFYSGDEGKARELFERVVAVGYWPAFGHIAAEADLARLDAKE